MRQLTFLLLLFMPFLNYGQTLGVLSGQVVDAQTGVGLEGATVLLENTALGVSTDASGYFTIKNIPPKTYNVVVSFLGFETYTQFNVIIKSVGTAPQQIALTPQEDTLEEVVVQSNPFKTTKETPLSTQTFSAVEIETYPGGNNDITKVVQSMPGISPSIGGFRNDIIIRGGAPNETVYYLDGIEIPNINHFSTQGSAGGPVGLINVSFIQDVTLSSSAFGAEYDNPLSGVLSFQQREGNPNGFGVNFRLGASEAALTLEGPLSSTKEGSARTTFIASVRRSYLQFLFELIGLPIRPDYWDFQWKVKHKINANNTLTFLGIGSVDDFSVKAPDSYDERQQAGLEQVPIIKQQSFTTGVVWKRVLADSKGLLETALSTNRLNNLFSRYKDNEAQEGLLFQNDSYEWETKLRTNLTVFAPRWKWNFGFNLQYSDYANTTSSIFYGVNYGTAVDFMKYGAFAKGQASYFDGRLDIGMGLRADADSFSTGSGFFDTLSPRVSLSYQLTPNDQWRFNASVGRYYKIPTYTMLGFQGLNGVFVNQNARYARSDHYVAGLEYRIGPAARLTAEGFLKQYSNYPVSVLDGVALANKGGGFEVLGNEAITDNGEGRSYGMELLYQQKLTKNFYGIFAYTYFFSEFTGVGSSYLPSVWDSRHLISFSGGYKLKKNWELSARWRYAGKTPYVPTDVDASLRAYPEIILDYSQLGTKKLNPFSLVDVRVDKKWNFSKYSLNLYFDFQNVLAQATPLPEEYGLARDSEGVALTPRRLVEISNDQQNNIPIPTFGIVLDF